jgi:DNA-binding transcriptional LysR family regulator
MLNASPGFLDLRLPAIDEHFDTVHEARVDARWSRGANLRPHAQVAYDLQRLRSDAKCCDCWNGHWRAQDGIVHLVFTTRTGLPPLVRAWIDHLANRFRQPLHP